MKEEIKEILELYKNDDIEYYNLVSDLGYDKLLDCIFNLEDTLKDREEYCYGLETQLTNLQEENERLKEENKHIFSKVNDDELLISNAMNYAEAQDYKQRNEKAIEYINKLSNEPNAFGHYGIDGNCKKYLLNILKGDKDE